eukprot:GHVL01018999.1.p1 GENE.GHVL01018999.1~~GHVL01018999.1.p1  ORF type:complete len:290 (-),score=37.42 GHVL01018999.1:1898-2767(-)
MKYYHFEDTGLDGLLVGGYSLVDDDGFLLSIDGDGTPQWNHPSFHTTGIEIQWGGVDESKKTLSLISWKSNVDSPHIAPVNLVGNSLFVCSIDVSDPNFIDLPNLLNCRKELLQPSLRIIGGEFLSKTNEILFFGWTSSSIQNESQVIFSHPNEGYNHWFIAKLQFFNLDFKWAYIDSNGRFNSGPFGYSHIGNWILLVGDRSHSVIYIIIYPFHRTDKLSNWKALWVHLETGAVRRSVDPSPITEGSLRHFSQASNFWDKKWGSWSHVVQLVDGSLQMSSYGKLKIAQ